MIKRRHAGLALSFVCLVTSACSDPLSPLAGVDEARLWGLLRAAPLGDGRPCAEVFLHRLNADDKAQRLQCERWAKVTAGYLAENGLAVLTAADLASPAYWRWFQETRERIAACKTALGNLAPNASAAERESHAEQRAHCDALDAYSAHDSGADV